MTEVLGAVVRLEPPWEALPADVPPPIRTLLQSCLVKDPRQRVADISIALFVLDKAASLAAPAIVPATTATGTPRQPLWKRAIPAAAALIVGAALATGAWWSFRPSTPPAVVTRFPFTLPEGQNFTALNRQAVVISPDGTQIVYVANNRLYLRSTSEFEARAIPGTEETQGAGLSNPVFSPDGRSIAFWSGADQTLKRIAVSGGAAVTICPADIAPGNKLGPRRDRVWAGSRRQRRHARVSERRHTGSSRQRQRRRAGVWSPDTA